MTAYIVKRCIAFPLVLLWVSIFVFAVMHMLPGNIAYAVLGPFAGKQEIAALDKTLGLNYSIPVQYAHWIGGLLRFDSGVSLKTGQSTAGQIWSRLPVTAEIAILSMILGGLWGIFCGTVAAIARGTWLDGTIMVSAVLGLAVPGFWLAVLAIVIPSVAFNWSPPIQYAAPWQNFLVHLQQVIFPIIILSFGASAQVARLMRTTMLGVLRSEYITTARSKGLSTRVVILRHALKNSLIPVVTVIGNQLGYLLGGAVLIETVFGLPGVGKLTYDSIVNRDLTQVQANVMFFAVVFLVLNLLVDLSYSWLDPRIHYS